MERIQHITTSQLKILLQSGEPLLLLDVREDFEHDHFNIGGQLIPLSELMSRANEIPADKPVIVYCRKVVRSQIAIQRLQAKGGFANLINLQGGVENWNSPT